MILTIEYSNGKTMKFHEDALRVDRAIDRAVKLGDIATETIKLSDGTDVRIFTNLLIASQIEY